MSDSRDERAWRFDECAGTSLAPRLKGNAIALQKFGAQALFEKVFGMNGFLTNSFDPRISYLKILALSLLREIASAETMSHGNGNGNANDAIDLQAEVRRFETELIRSALIQTGGRQRQAARLLGTKVTTLNTKIKRYKIDISESVVPTF